jgi:hypothetical protein
MKTLNTTIALLFFSITVFSQNYLVVNNSTTDNIYEKPRLRSIKKAKTIDSFTLEIYNNDDFDYRDFLSDSENSKVSYRIGTQSYTKKEIAKIFRKGARKSENIEEFEAYLNKINPKFVPNISERETEDIFTKFREGTLHAYLDELSEDGVILF